MGQPLIVTIAQGLAVSVRCAECKGGKVGSGEEMAVDQLHIDLPADMVEMVRLEVERGAHASSSDLVLEALQPLKDRAEESRRRITNIRTAIEDAAQDPRRLTDEDVGEHFDRSFVDPQRNLPK